VAVVPECRLRGIGRAMVRWCLERLTAAGVGRSHIFVNADNADAKVFWRHVGWDERPSVHVMSITTNPDRV
jgi:GNAT superfamily N-acetyltransferase